MKTLFYSLFVVLFVAANTPTATAQAKSGDAKSLKVLFYLQDGVEILDFAGPMEVFTAAGFDVSTVSKTKEPIVSQDVLKIIPQYSIEDAPHADIIAVFGERVLMTRQLLNG